jgi:hypothetical protein
MTLAAPLFAANAVTFPVPLAPPGWDAGLKVALAIGRPTTAAVREKMIGLTAARIVDCTGVRSLAHLRCDTP